ncbi:MAG: aryl-sulfate sulfotransferase [Gammaproteobacteria bacterium]|nr:aryl-sulfate sulfotransferase [Gammaproteobacteria bacterium]
MENQNRSRRLAWTAAAAALVLSMSQAANAQTFGLIESEIHSSGYTLYAPIRGTSAYLIDGKGRLIKRWQDPDGYSGGASSYLTKRGTLVRAMLKGDSGNAGAGNGGLIREYDWDGNVIWDYDYDDPSYWTHHDIALMPNGHVIITAFEFVLLDENNSCRNADGSINRVDPETEGAQRFDHLIEVDPNYKTGYGGKTEWEWHLCDHLDDGTSAAKWDVSLNQSYNAINYTALRDQILIGCNACNEMFIIDHNTNSHEAAGSKGDFIYRWGNPGNYGATGDTLLGGQHTVRFIRPEFGNDLLNHGNTNNTGNIIAYNNRHMGFNSAVIEITPPYNAATNDYGTHAPGVGFEPADYAAVLMDITDDTGARNFFSGFLSSGQKL